MFSRPVRERLVSRVLVMKSLWSGTVQKQRHAFCLGCDVEMWILTFFRLLQSPTFYLNCSYRPTV